MTIALSGCYVQLRLCFVQNMLIFQYFLKKHFFDPYICTETFEKGLGLTLKVIK